MFGAGLVFQLISICSYEHSRSIYESSNLASNQTIASSEWNKGNSRLEESTLSREGEDAIGFFGIGTLSQIVSTVAFIGAYKLKGK